VLSIILYVYIKLSVPDTIAIMAITKTIRKTRRKSKSVKSNVKSNVNSNTKLLTKTINTNREILIPIYKLTPSQIGQLTYITCNKTTMKHIGTGKLWKRADILQFIKDELAQQRKKVEDREYFTYVMISASGKVIGLISGRKNIKLLGNDKKSQYDILLRMFISALETGKGFGKSIISKFATLYKSLIGNNNANLISDIAVDNLASIKIHDANDFNFIKQIKYPNGKFYKRYVKKI
jgi:L-amino acid N-acyltransferase YncA